MPSPQAVQWVGWRECVGRPWCRKHPTELHGASRFPAISLSMACRQGGHVGHQTFEATAGEMNQKPLDLQSVELRRRAFERMPSDGAPEHDSDAGVRKFLHELQVHQSELELQNEDLANANAKRTMPCSATPTCTTSRPSATSLSILSGGSSKRTRRLPRF